VRQLENVVARMVALSGGGEIGVESFVETTSAARVGPEPDADGGSLDRPLHAALEEP